MRAPAEPDDLNGPAETLIPAGADIEALRQAAKGCRACDLYKLGTQTVFGEGSSKARIMMVGEQPGDKEDLAGRPFVGPAGQILNKALAEAGIDRNEVYVTNAVKHFKWVPQAGRRLHQKPNRREQIACRPWLDAEIARVQPEVLVLLGATAAQSLLGATFRLTQHRGQFLHSDLAKNVIATLHPSAVLRQPDEQSKKEAYEGLISDFKLVASRIRLPGAFLS